VHSFIDEKRIEAENNVNIIDSDRQLGWHPVAAVQYTFTHKQYIEQPK
jgi:hypothetical protein